MFADVSLQVVVDVDAPYSGRRAGKDEVAYFEREKAACIGDDFVDGKNHVAGVSRLFQFVVDAQRELDVLNLRELFYRDECADYRRSVEGFADFPRGTRSPLPLLQVACGNVDAYRYGVVVTVGKPGGDVFTQPPDAEYQLRFVFRLGGEVGDKERFPVFQQGRVGFHKQGRFCREIFPFHLFVVVGIVPPDGNDFHLLDCFWIRQMYG